MIGEALAAAILVGAEPPARYDYPYQGQIIVNAHESWRARTRACREGWRIVGRFACARIDWEQQVCVMELPSPRLVGEEVYDVLYRHEQAHCNGWPADHPR